MLSGDPVKYHGPRRWSSASERVGAAPGRHAAGYSTINVTVCGTLVTQPWVATTRW